MDECFRLQERVALMEVELRDREDTIDQMNKEHQAQTSKIRTKYVDKKIEHAGELRKLKADIDK